MSVFLHSAFCAGGGGCSLYVHFAHVFITYISSWSLCCVRIFPPSRCGNVSVGVVSRVILVKNRVSCTFFPIIICGLIRDKNKSTVTTWPRHGRNNCNTCRCGRALPVRWRPRAASLCDRTKLFAKDARLASNAPASTVGTTIPKAGRNFRMFYKKNRSDLYRIWKVYQRHT